MGFGVSIILFLVFLSIFVSGINLAYASNGALDVPESGEGIILMILLFVFLILGMFVFNHFHEKKIKINDLKKRQQKYIDKEVVVDGTITSSKKLSNNEVVYIIKDSTGSIKGFSRRTGYSGRGIIKGTLRKKKDMLYLEF